MLLAHQFLRHGPALVPACPLRLCVKLPFPVDDDSLHGIRKDILAVDQEVEVKRRHSMISPPEARPVAASSWRTLAVSLAKLQGT